MVSVPVILRADNPRAGPRARGAEIQQTFRLNVVGETQAAGGYGSSPARSDDE